MTDFGILSIVNTIQKVMRDEKIRKLKADDDKQRTGNRLVHPELVMHYMAEDWDKLPYKAKI
jgi:hypothetical protein